jgi:hypothetical protein
MCEVQSSDVIVRPTRRDRCATTPAAHPSDMAQCPPAGMYPGKYLYTTQMRAADVVFQLEKILCSEAFWKHGKLHLPTSTELPIHLPLENPFVLKRIHKECYSMRKEILLEGM